jgi:hypothetical protein
MCSKEIRYIVKMLMKGTVLAFVRVSGWILRTYLLTSYLLTPWSRILLEKLTGFQLVKKFPAFYETREFIAAFTSAR